MSALLVVDMLLLAIAVVVLVPVLVLVAELVVASLGRSGPAPSLPSRTARLAVLMPAHDEAAGIEPVIAALRPQLMAGDRLLVVADNCSDATAAIARAAGAAVVERSDTSRRGKGYALDFGVRWLEHDPPGVVVIVDADCIVAPGALERLASRCLASARPVQALYLMHAPSPASTGARIAEFAWTVKNHVRPLGGSRLGWPCQLMGTGMAFPWSIIQRAPLASGHLVEDMQLGMDLAAAGTPPEFCEQALVSSVFPTDKAGVSSQRTRWEHGHLSVIASVGPRLLWRAVSTGNGKLAAMVLDMMVPPLASLVLALVGVFGASGLWLVFGGSALPFALASLALALLVGGVLMAWYRFGRGIVSARGLASLPFYVLAKIPVYVRLFTKRQVDWVRTKRDGHGR